MPMGYYYWFDPLYFLVMIPAVLLGLWAQGKVKAAYAKYSKVATDRGLSGAEIARAILRAEGITDVRVEQVSGFLSDHYHPIKKVLNLSPDVYHGRSVSAAGIAAHEVGHAIQQARGFVPLRLRSALATPTQIGSALWWLPVVLGFVMGGLRSVAGANLIYAGMALLALTAVFALVTLPVEFDASRRAILVLEGGGIVTQRESQGVRKVLTAAALTYVAGAVTAVLTLLYYAWRLGLLGGGRRD